MALEEIRDQARKLRHERRKAGWRRRRAPAITSYLQTHEVRKVQIGTGDHELPGWLNTDAWPRTDNVIYVDMTESLPFPDNCLQYMYSEHAIEHISHAEALAFLRECRRTLDTGGTLRLATPNLLHLLDLYQPTLTSEQQTYLSWAVERNQLPRLNDSRCFVLNNFMRAWGHQFIYDPETLTAILIEAGFARPCFFAPSHSNDAVLIGIEHHGATIGEAFNRLETMVVEAQIE